MSTTLPVASTPAAAPEQDAVLAPSTPGATPPAPSDESGNEALDQPIRSGWLLKFSMPTIVSFIVMNALGMVDGIFASRVISPMAFAAVNLVWPFMAFVAAVGMMLSIGGSAVVAKMLGQGKVDEARGVFSMLTLVTLGASVAVSAIGFLAPDFVMNVLGVDDYLRPMAMEYLQPMLWILPFAMLGWFIQQYFITEGRPNLGFYATAVSGVLNIALNFLFISHLDMGLEGAALATGLGMMIPAIVGVVFFARNRRGVLFFTRPRGSLAILGRSSLNGSSEMVTMLATSVLQVRMNNILMDLVGFEGVAAAGVMFVGQALLMSFFMGYASGIAPIISFNFGKGDRDRLRRLFRRSMVIITVSAVVSIAAGWVLAHPLTLIYLDAGTPMYDMAIHAFRVGLFGFVFVGINGFASIMYTALNNGVASGLLAFFRTFVFVLAMLALLPNWFDVEGVWIALPAAEALAFLMTIGVFVALRKKYGYMGRA